MSENVCKGLNKASMTSPSIAAFTSSLSHYESAPSPKKVYKECPNLSMENQKKAVVCKDNNKTLLLTVKQARTNHDH